MGKQRAAKGMGSVYQRKSDGRWVGAFYDDNGKRHPFYAKSEKEAVERLKKEQENARSGKLITSKDTFGFWLNEWLEVYVKPNKRTTTYDSYKGYADNHIIPALGKFMLKDLKTNQIQKFYNTLQKTKLQRNEDKNISAGTIRKIHAIIHKCLEKALTDEKIYKNPASAVELPDIEDQEARYLAPEELKGFLSTTIEDRWHPAYVIDANSGLRLGELVGLRWPNVILNKDKSIIKVREAVSWVKEGDGWILETHKPKNKKKGIRDVPLPSEAVKAFEKIKARQAAEKLKLGEAYKNEQNYVFTWEDGRIVDPFYLSKHFADLSEKQGLDINFHGLRHTYCSILISKNVDIKTCQKLLGDATTNMVLDVYTHVFSGAMEEAVSKLEGIL